MVDAPALRRFINPTVLALAVIALATLASASAAMAWRNLIHSALLLTGTWAGIAAFYLWAGAEFVAFAQVLVYVGAISMVVLFAVLLTRRVRDDVTLASGSLARALSALVTGGAVLGVLCGAVLSTPLPVGSERRPAIPVAELGAQLMGPHAAALLIVGIVLTVSLLGAVVIAATDRPAERRAPGAGRPRPEEKRA